MPTRCARPEGRGLAGATARRGAAELPRQRFAWRGESRRTDVGQLFRCSKQRSQSAGYVACMHACMHVHSICALLSAVPFPAPGPPLPRCCAGAGPAGCRCVGQHPPGARSAPRLSSHARGHGRQHMHAGASPAAFGGASCSAGQTAARWSPVHVGIIELRAHPRSTRLPSPLQTAASPTTPPTLRTRRPWRPPSGPC